MQHVVQIPLLKRLVPRPLLRIVGDVDECNFALPFWVYGQNLVAVDVFADAAYDIVALLLLLCWH